MNREEKMKAFGDKLYACRADAGCTQAAFGKRMGFSGTTISSWEAGRTFPAEDSFDTLCRHFPALDTEEHRALILAPKATRANQPNPNPRPGPRRGGTHVHQRVRTDGSLDAFLSRLRSGGYQSEATAKRAASRLSARWSGGQYPRALSAITEYYLRPAPNGGGVGMISLEDAPRTLKGLKGLIRGIRYRLAMQLGALGTEEEEMSFNSSSDEDQCELLLAALKRYDDERNQAQEQPPEQAEAFEQVQINGWPLVRIPGEEEPRIPDFVEAERLGYDQARSIRKLIRRNEEEFRRHGHLDMRSVVDRISKPQGGYEDRVVEVFYLNEDQALLAAMLSRTGKAADVRYEIIQAYKAYRELVRGIVGSSKVLKVVEANQDKLEQLLTASVQQHERLRVLTSVLQNATRILDKLKLRLGGQPEPPESPEPPPEEAPMWRREEDGTLVDPGGKRYWPLKDFVWSVAESACMPQEKVTKEVMEKLCLMAGYPMEVVKYKAVYVVPAFFRPPSAAFTQVVKYANRWHLRGRPEFTTDDRNAAFDEDSTFRRLRALYGLHQALARHAQLLESESR